MKNKNLFRQKYILHFISYSAIILFFIGLLVNIINPFDNGAYLISRTENNIIKIFFSYMIYLIIAITFILLSKLTKFDKISRNFLSTYIFVMGLLLTLSPGIFSSHLFSSDSAYHLWIVKSMIKKGYSWAFNINQSYRYVFFIFHYSIAVISIFLNISPHTLFLFLPQTIMFLLFYVGSYKLIYQKMEFQNKNICFIFLVLHPFISIRKISFMAPFLFIVSFMPLIINLLLDIYNGDKLFKDIIKLFFINLITISSHILGIFIFLISIIGIGTYYLKKGEKFQKPKKRLFLIGFFYFSIIIFFIFIKRIRILLYQVLVELNFNRDFISEVISGLKFETNLISFFSFRSPYDFIIFLMVKLPILIIPILSISNYSVNYILKKDIKKSNFDNLRIIADILFPFIISTWFFGKNLLLFRFFNFTSALYFLMFLYVISHSFNLKVLIKEVNMRMHNMNLDHHTIKNGFYILIILSYFVLPFPGTLGPYREAHYETARWINENLDEESYIFTSYRLSQFLKGTTHCNTNYGFGNLFNSSFSEEKRIEYFYTYYGKNNIGNFLVVDLDYKLYTKEDSEQFPNSLFDIGGIDYLNNSDYFDYKYKNEKIIIYQIIK